MESNSHPFSASSLSSRCASIVSRAVSASAEIDDTLKSTRPGDGIHEALSSLKTLLEVTESSVEDFQGLRFQDLVVSPPLQDDLPRHLKHAEAAIAVIAKQLARSASTDSDTEVNPSVISSYIKYLEAQDRLIEAYHSVLQL